MSVSYVWRWWEKEVVDVAGEGEDDKIIDLPSFNFKLRGVIGGKIFFFTKSSPLLDNCATSIFINHISEINMTCKMNG